MAVRQQVVDDRVFMLGLDKLYRDAMKRHEQDELLVCAQRVAEALHVGPADVPIEGYYVENDRLTEYFRLMRALQKVAAKAGAVISSSPELKRLREVVSSRLFGFAESSENWLLPTMMDSLSSALEQNAPHWSLDGLTSTACTIAHEMDDFSLVGLAARVRDPVFLTATRESAVLYAASMVMDMGGPPPEYIWKVDRELAEQARRFIQTFRDLFEEDLPPPEPGQAEVYWKAFNRSDLVGRCVHLGLDDRPSPPEHYHWAICVEEWKPVAQDFWATDIWTTERYKAALGRFLECPDL